MSGTDHGVDFQIAQAFSLLDDRGSVIDENPIANRALPIRTSARSGVDIGRSLADPKQGLEEYSAEPVVALDVAINALKGDRGIAAGLQGAGDLFGGVAFHDLRVDEGFQIAGDVLAAMRGMTNAKCLSVSIFGIVAVPAGASPKLPGDG